MDTSDDPVTLVTVAALAGTGAVAKNNLFKAGSIDMPIQPVEQAKQTAVPMAQTSEQARKARLKSASMLTKNWTAPTLSKPGLLG